MDKALVLLSGGLDSQLVVKLLEKEGYSVTGLIFKSAFFDEKKGVSAAKKLGIKYLVKDISQPHLKIVKQPQFGHGVGLNPCIDCHLLMLTEAKKIMDKQGFDIVATGEVLGQRPFSQNKQALDLIAQRSGLEDKLRRPLIDQGISGRGRSDQLKLAKRFNLKDYPQPAGGCILCDQHFSKNLKKLLEIKPRVNINDVNLLRFGRVFFIDKSLVILGRNKGENEQINKQAQKGDLLIEPKDFPGPTALIRGKPQPVEKVKKLIIKYSKANSSQLRTDWVELILGPKPSK